MALRASTESHAEDPADTAAGGVPPPLYAAQLPDPALLRFQLRRGEQQGEAQLRWQHGGDRYEIGFDATLADRSLFQQRSSGLIGPHGLMPERFQDKRRGRSLQQAHLDVPAGRIHFSTRAPDLPAWPGAQDRAGWIVQLTAIVAAELVPPPEVRLFVVGARGGAGWWTFALRGTVDVDTTSGRVQALHYDRAPAVPRDQRVEAWLDPLRGHWPVRLRFTPVLGGSPLELWLDGEPSTP